MKFRPNTATIAIYCLFTLIWFACHTLTSELRETTIPVLEHAKISQHRDKYPTNTLLHDIKKKIVSLQEKLQLYDENRIQELPQNFTKIRQQITFLQQKLEPPQNTLTLYNAINNNVSVIFLPFLTMKDILILRGTCKDFQILLQQNKQNDMVEFCKNFRSKDTYVAPLKWFDLKYLLNQSYVTAFSQIEMFNIKISEYALLIDYTVPKCHKNIISWHNTDIDYRQILVDNATKEIVKDDHKLLLPRYDYPIIIYNEFRTAWAKITKERNVVTGGGIVYEGDPTQLKNVKIIASNTFSFAALLDDGHVIAWGNEYTGGVIPDEIQTQLQNVKMIFSNLLAFAALLDDGHVVAWGSLNTGGEIPDEIQTKLQNVKMIFSSIMAFAGLLDDGHVVAWGAEDAGGIIPDKIQTQLQNVKTIVSNDQAFAGLLDDGHVVAWGLGICGGVIPDEIQIQLQNVKMIFSTNRAFAALLDNGHVVAWGNDQSGGIIPDKIQTQLQNVKMIFSTNGAFAALLDNGHVVVWGFGDIGGVIPDEIQTKLQNVKMIFSNYVAFAALLDDGSVFAWGNPYEGGRIPNEIQQKLINNVKTIVPEKRSFTAFCNDGEIIIWGLN